MPEAKAERPARPWRRSPTTPTAVDDAVPGTASLSPDSPAPPRSKGGPGIAVEIVIGAPSPFVWSDIEDITAHADWMQDAVEIRFLSESHRGVGTRFECDTAVGPLKLTDVMEVTEWQHGRTIGVDHQGLVGGSGVFTLRPSGTNTVLSWVEKLRFPWYLGGPLGAMAARPVLRHIWRANLRRLKLRIESRYVEQRTAQQSAVAEQRGGAKP